MGPIDLNAETHDIALPHSVAVCPECRGTLWVEATEWVKESGKPTRAGIYLHCEDEDKNHHENLFHDWVNIHWLAENWTGAVDHI